MRLPMYLAVLLLAFYVVWALTLYALENWLQRDVPAGIGMVIGIAYLVVVGTMAIRHFGLL